jgi:hypothetical protein
MAPVTVRSDKNYSNSFHLGSLCSGGVTINPQKITQLGGGMKKNGGAEGIAQPFPINCCPLLVFQCKIANKVTNNVKNAYS